MSTTHGDPAENQAAPAGKAGSWLSFGKRKKATIRRTKPAAAAGDLIAKIRADTREDARKIWPLLLALLGFALILSGEIWLFHLKEAPEEIVHLTVQEEIANGVLTGNANSRRSAPPAVTHRFGPPVMEFIPEFIVKFGELLLIGCFLELLLHSNHYGAFFLGLVEEAMMGERLAERFGTNAGLWRKVSEVYFSRRFPEIKERLSETLYSYFPTDHKFYLNDYRYIIRFSLDADGFIIAEEDISYTVVPAEIPDQSAERNEVPFILRNVIFRAGPNDRKTEATVIGLRVGDQDITQECRYEEIDFKGKPVLALDVRRLDLGAGVRNVQIQLKKIWNLEVDPYKTFTTSSLINDLSVRVEWSEGLNVEWMDMGVKNAFQNVFESPAELTKRQIMREYKGLIFQNQGFKLVIRKA